MFNLLPKQIKYPWAHPYSALTTAIGLIFGLTFSGCGEEGETTPTTLTNPAGYSQSNDSSITLKLLGDAPVALTTATIDVTDKDGVVIGALVLDNAQLSMDKIKLKMEGEDELNLQDESESESTNTEDEEEREFKGPFLVDLIANTVTPTPPEAKVPAGDYKEIELSVHKIEDEDLADLTMDKNDTMYKRSIYVSGIYTPTGGSAVNFSMSYELSEEYKLSGSNAFSIGSGLVNDLVIAFRLPRWFVFDNAETNSDGLSFADLPVGDISLTEDSDEIAKKIRSIIKENIKLSADFGKDQDGDGKLSNDEDTESPDEDDD